MTSLKIASWNINSVRLRIDRVINFLRTENIDILALQETKTVDESFPKDALIEAGYPHLYFWGMKSYNGVCFISKYPLDLCENHMRDNKDDCRHISARVTVPFMDKPIMLDNLYIPAGGDEPDITVNEKFAHKLNFVDEMRDWFPKNRSDGHYSITMGDFNIAPYENDVWSHKQLLKIISHTPIEVEKLNAMKDAFNWTDVARHFVDADEKLYSWWSYRNRDWRKSNRGRRLDHIWTSSNLQNYLHGFEVIEDQRDVDESGGKPSDHVPIILTLKF